MAKERVNIKDIALIAPEFKNSDPSKYLSQDYNKFNIELFYQFCRENPIDGSPQDFMYPFINLTNVDQKELDKFVIGSWMQNHQSEDKMKQELSEKIVNVISRIQTYA